MKRVLGVVVLLFGVALGCWLVYNLVAGVQPEARGHRPLPAFLLTAGALYVGVKWIRGQ